MIARASIVATSEPTVAPACPEGEGDSSSQPRLLIVDDIADNRAILARRFQRRGFHITEAAGGHEALELIERHAFDLVLLDVMMPDIDGIEVLKRVREHHTAVALPVIMVTAKSQSEDVVGALELGANDYVTKPVDFAVALARANAQIGRKRAEEAAARAAEALRLANEDLERRVVERTAKLLEANRNLETEIAERLKSEAATRYLAHHDVLTGLPNRVLFRKELERALANARANAGSELAVLFLDLDGFKGVNDTLGHSVGDALLKSIAERLQTAIGAEDFIARLGGDEFAVLQLSGEQPGAAAALASRIIQSVSTPCTIEGHQVVVGASVGITAGGHEAADPEALLKSADLAMYRAKADGRGTYRFFEPEMDSQAQARRSIEIDLRQALIEGAFELYYQPIVNLASGQASGCEALLRWKHPERGFVSPAAFIPVAEEIGLIVPIGEWALRQACAEAATWPGDMRVAVNLSPVQFKSGNVVASVMSALAASGLPANRLEVEVTESILLEKTEANLAVLRNLHELGVRISLDDFGTGYSSLSYLQSFHFDKIKIDRSFVRDLRPEGEKLAIVRAIASLGASFGIATTAEGVETEDELQCVRQEGCTEVQGYYFSPPRPALQLLEVLAKIKGE